MAVFGLFWGFVVGFEVVGDILGVCPGLFIVGFLFRVCVGCFGVVFGAVLSSVGMLVLLGFWCFVVLLFWGGFCVGILSCFGESFGLGFLGGRKKRGFAPLSCSWCCGGYPFAVDGASKVYRCCLALPTSTKPTAMV